MCDEVITQGLPLPLPSVDNVEFYRAAQRGELSFQRCSDCRAWRHYPLPVCPECASTSFASSPLISTGVINTRVGQRESSA